MASNETKKTVMASAATNAQLEPSIPWFKDDEKLIRAALQGKYPNRDLKRLIRKLVSDIAVKDDDFRVELSKDLAELGKGKFHRPNTYPRWFRMMLMDELRVWRSAGIIKNLPEGYAKAAELHRSEFPELTEDAVRGVYQRERAAMQIHKTP